MILFVVCSVLMETRTRIQKTQGKYKGGERNKKKIRPKNARKDCKRKINAKVHEQGHD